MVEVKWSLKVILISLLLECILGRLNPGLSWPDVG